MQADRQSDIIIGLGDFVLLPGEKYVGLDVRPNIIVYTHCEQAFHETVHKTS